MATGLRELKVWQEAVALAADTVRAVRRANRREPHPVLLNLVSTTVELASDIAEGAGRWDPAEQRVLYARARGATLRCETLLAIARQGELLDVATQARLLERLALVSRLLGGYLAYLDRQLAAPPRPGEAMVTASL